jgi:hypothetical protein
VPWTWLEGSETLLPLEPQAGQEVASPAFR